MNREQRKYFQDRLANESQKIINQLQLQKAEVKFPNEQEKCLELLESNPKLQKKLIQVFLDHGKKCCSEGNRFAVYWDRGYSGDLSLLKVIPEFQKICDDIQKQRSKVDKEYEEKFNRIFELKRKTLDEVMFADAAEDLKQALTDFAAAASKLV